MWSEKILFWKGWHHIMSKKRRISHYTRSQRFDQTRYKLWTIALDQITIPTSRTATSRLTNSPRMLVPLWYTSASVKKSPGGLVGRCRRGRNSSQYSISWGTMTDSFSDKISWNGLYKETLGLHLMLSTILMLQTRYSTYISQTQWPCQSEFILCLTRSMKETSLESHNP